MKAAVLTKWKDPAGFNIKDIEKPTPKDTEILIKIIASSVTAGDCEIRGLKLPLGLSLPIRIYAGWRKPDRLKVLGQEYSGIVEQVGKDVTNFNIGDEVFGTTGFSFGAYSEYLCMPATPKDTQGVITHKPLNITHNEAAILPTAGMEALHYMNKSSIKQGQKLLIIGAGGSIGTLTLQLAKSNGVHVTVIDREEKLEMLQQLGADKVVNYTKESIWKSGEQFDLIIDVVGKGTVTKSLKLLKKHGSYYLAYAKIIHLWLGLFTRIFLKKELTVQAANQTKEELESLKNSVESGLIKPVIDRVFSLEETSQAHRYADSGLKQGNIAITIAETS